MICNTHAGADQRLLPLLQQIDAIDREVGELEGVVQALDAHTTTLALQIRDLYEL
jgi:hypothetical protein